jgi:putative phosphoribosyl transferase
MFVDRTDAGRLLAARLADYSLPNPLVLGLPRGGVPVAVEVAEWLDADLDVLVVRKLGVPGSPEFAMGAIGEDGVRIVDEALCQQLGITDEQVERVASDQAREVERRVQRYRDGRTKLGIAGRNAIIIDDGLATGSTAAAAVAVVKHLGARHVTVAAPVGSVQAETWLRTLADDVVCLKTPDPFYAVSQHFDMFAQVSDDEVVRVLRMHPRAGEPLAADGDRINADVVIESGPLSLPGRICIPARSRGIVVFAHGSGSSRFSPRNVSVANALNGAGLGTLLFDLLTDYEADHRATIFDIELLASRIALATSWVQEQDFAEGRKIGLFGASTGAAAALVAAARNPNVVSAVVSRGGRPDLAGHYLSQVQAPTLLIVGGHDYDVARINREAASRLRCTHLVETISGATHLFEEPGALCQVSRLAQTWFLQYLR